MAKTVRAYVCGPTVYDLAHLGHARTYVVYDAWFRYFETLGYTVDYVMNITDVDDKIIAKVNSAMPEPWDYNKFQSRYYRLINQMEAGFWSDLVKLGVRQPRVVRVTEHITAMIEFIEKILERGYAYVHDGSVYLDYVKYSQDIEGTTLVAEPTAKKRDHRDFALWKASKPREIYWSSPWGLGRPGWHIECTVLSYLHLGPEFDIHGGGIDLEFPHHRNELIQLQAYLGRTVKMAKFVHTGHLHIAGCKMAKSLKNFITIRELTSKISGNALRWMFLSTNWRKPLEYSEELAEQCQKQVEKFQDLIHQVADYCRIHSITLDSKVVDIPGLSEDFAIHKVLGTYPSLVSELNNQLSTGKPLDLVKYQAFRVLLTQLGFTFTEEREPLVSAVIEFRHHIRQAARRKDWPAVFATLDKFRDHVLPAHGIRIVDA